MPPRRGTPGRTRTAPAGVTTRARAAGHHQHPRAQAGLTRYLTGKTTWCRLLKPARCSWDSWAKATGSVTCTRPSGCIHCAVRALPSAVGRPARATSPGPAAPALTLKAGGQSEAAGAMTMLNARPRCTCPEAGQIPRSHPHRPAPQAPSRASCSAWSSQVAGRPLRAPLMWAEQGFLRVPVLQDAESCPSLAQRLGAGLAAAATVLATTLAVPQVTQRPRAAAVLAWAACVGQTRARMRMPTMTEVAVVCSWCPRRTQA